MKITNKQFMDIYLREISARETLAFLTTIQKLLSRHKINEVARVKSEDPMIVDLQAMIHVLQNHNKLNKMDISSLIRFTVSAGGDEAKQFLLITNAEGMQERMKHLVDKKTDMDVERTDNIGMILQGDGRTYKRTLKTDIEKLLR